jgi:hypothetical protein
MLKGKSRIVVLARTSDIDGLASYLRTCRESGSLEIAPPDGKSGDTER